MTKKNEKVLTVAVWCIFSITATEGINPPGMKLRQIILREGAKHAGGKLKNINNLGVLAFLRANDQFLLRSDRLSFCRSWR